MSEGAAGEGEVCVGQDGDNADTVDAVDMRYNLPRFSCCVSSHMRVGGRQCHLSHTLCMVKSQFSSMKAWYRNVKSGTCQALTGGGEGYIGKSLMFRVFNSSG